MKIALVLFATLLLTVSIRSQPGQTWGPSMNQRSRVMAPNPVNQTQPPAQSQPDRFVALDPVRVLDGQTEMANGKGWDWFEGRVIEVQPTGIRVSGLYTQAGGDSQNMTELLYQPQEFFVRNFPYSVAENDRLSSTVHYTAKIAENYSYTTTLGGSRTIHCLDYGMIWTPPPPTPEQIAQAKTNAIIAKVARRSRGTRSVRAVSRARSAARAFSSFRKG